MPIDKILMSRVQQISREAITPALNEQKFYAILKMAEALHVMATKTNHPEIRIALKEIFDLLDKQFEVPKFDPDNPKAGVREEIQHLRRQTKTYGISENDPDALQLTLQAIFLEKMKNKEAYTKECDSFIRKLSRKISSVPKTSKQTTLEKNLEENIEKTDTLLKELEVLEQVQKFIKSIRKDNIKDLAPYLLGIKEKHKNLHQVTKFVQGLEAKIPSKYNKEISKMAKAIDKERKENKEKIKELKNNKNLIQKSIYNQEVKVRFDMAVKKFNKFYQDPSICAANTNATGFFASAKELINSIQRMELITKPLEGIKGTETYHGKNFLTKIIRPVLGLILTQKKKNVSIQNQTLKTVHPYQFKVKEPKHQIAQTAEKPPSDWYQSLQEKASQVLQMGNEIADTISGKTTTPNVALADLPLKNLEEITVTIFKKTLENLEKLTQNPPGLVQEKEWISEINKMKALLKIENNSTKQCEQMIKKMGQLANKLPHHNNPQLISFISSIHLAHSTISELYPALKFATQIYKKIAPKIGSLKQTTEKNPLENAPWYTRAFGNTAYKGFTQLIQKLSKDALSDTIKIIEQYSSSVEHEITLLPPSNPEMQIPIETFQAAIPSSAEIDRTLQALKSDLLAPSAQLPMVESFQKRIEENRSHLQERLNTIDKNDTALGEKLSRLETKRDKEKQENQQKNFLSRTISQVGELLYNNPDDARIENIQKILEKNKKETLCLIALQDGFEYFNSFLLGLDPPDLNDGNAIILLNINDINNRYIELLKTLEEIPDFSEKNPSFKSYITETFLYFDSCAANQLLKNAVLEFERLKHDENNNIEEKVEQYLDILNFANQIHDKNDNIGRREIESKIINNLKSEILHNTNQVLQKLSWENMEKHGIKNYNEVLGAAKKIVNAIQKNKHLIDEDIMAKTISIGKKVEFYENLNNSNEKFENLIKNMKVHASNTKNELNYIPMAEFYQKKYNTSYFLKNIRNSHRKGDIDFLQNIIDSLNKDKDMLPANKAAVFLGALNHLDKELQAGHFTLDIKNFKSMINEIKDEVFRDIEIDAPDIYKIIEEKSKPELFEFINQNKKEFEKLAITRHIIHPSNKPILHQHTTSGIGGKDKNTKKTHGTKPTKLGPQHKKEK